jgi:hypothetical protein
MDARRILSACRRGFESGKSWNFFLSVHTLHIYHLEECRIESRIGHKEQFKRVLPEIPFSLAIFKEWGNIQKWGNIQEWAG